jgi:hypothetical protein
MAASVAELREVLARRFPDAVPVRYGTAVPAATGVAALDRVLPGGGLPRGRLTVWAPGGGAAAVLRGACGEVVAGGERAAWVEVGEVGGVGGVGGALTGVGWRPEVLLWRPAGAVAGLECAEELLRTAGFGLVVLSGAEAGRMGAVRLARAAREGGGAFVLLAGGGVSAPLRLSSRILPEGYRWRPGPFGGPAEVDSALVRVQVNGLGVNAWAEFSLPVVQHEVRLSLEPGLVDRRGVGA